MRSVVLRSARDLAFEDRPVPTPEPGEVRVRICVVGICGSDLHFYADGRSGSCLVDRPLVLGHEFSGVIDAVGPGVARDRVGERVSVEPGIACGRCGYCRRGNDNLCVAMRFLGACPHDGAMQESVCVPDGAAHIFPDGVSFTAGALIEPLSVAVHAGRQGEVTAGDRVLVVGAGPIGLLVADVVRQVHSAEATVIDIDPNRRDIALARGSHVKGEAQLNDVESYDRLIECSGSSAALTAHLSSVRRGGTVVLVGVGPRQLSVPMDLVQEGELTLRGSHRYVRTWPDAIELAASGRIDLDSLVTARFGLDEVESALTGSRGIKTVIDVHQVGVEA